jgi:fructokinase
MTMELVCLGVLIMDMFPAETGKRLAEVSAYKPAPGGAPANVAVAAARLGTKSAFIGKVGDDAFGHYLVNVIKNEGVETKGVRFDKEARTTMNFHAKPKDGVIEYLFYRNPGADTTLRIDELDTELIKNAKALHFDSLCLTDEPCKSATLEALRIAKKAGIIVSFDVNYRPVVWKNPEQAIQCVYNTIGQADILKMNGDELKLICGGKPIENAVLSLLEKGPKLCVVTLGAKGSFFMTRSHHGFMKTIDVKVVDAIGCGDAFIAGLLSRIIEGGADISRVDFKTLREYIAFADTVASLTATRHGAIPAMPLLSEVVHLNQKR